MNEADAPPYQGPVLQVALDVPLRRLFDYLPPADAGPDALEPGQRVEVPFGRGKRIGIIVAIAAGSPLPRARLRHALALLDRSPLLGPDTLTLLGWAAGYYRHAPGEVMFAALPALLRAGRSASLPVSLRWSALPGAAEAPQLRRAPRQAALLRLLAEAGDGLTESALDLAFERWREPLRKLAERGLVQSRADAAAVRPSQIPPVADRPALTAAQAAACEAVAAAAGGFQTFLLDGVTGSGKTEVYLRCTELALERGQQVLVLIPEISLAGQTLARFAERFRPAGVAVLHSGLTDSERLRAWLQARAGEVGVVIGTRSAVWVPLARPGLIVVDEEHDLSFKQQEGFRYNARDVAVVRARRDAVPLLLGSATPSLESLYNVEQGRYQSLRLPERAGASAPSVHIVDIRNQPLREGIAEPALATIERHLAGGGQVLVFMNRRGWAPAVVCLGCGEPYSCARCDARLVYHRREERLRCHHCGAERAFPCPCPACQEEVPYLVGQGTQRLEAALAERFPGYRILRIDRDATRRKGELERHLRLARDGAARLLVGTQMMSKGHDFPNLSLVVILDTDGRLYGADFRAAERLAQLLVQVSGRAGRADRPGTVLLQTAFPDHPLLAAVAAGDYHHYARAALGERAGAGLPPYSAMALLRAQAKGREQVNAFLGAAALLAGEADGPEVLGPAPAPMERLAGDYRGQLLVIAAGRPLLGSFMDRWLPAVEALESARRVRWSIDIDPQEIL